jgi:signal recognition particle subunit SRP54
MFDNLTDRLSRTLRNISGRGRLTEDNIKDTLREVRMALLEADVALPVVRDFISRVKESAVGHEVNKSLTPGQEFVKIVRNELVAAMGEENQTLDLAAQPPAVVLMAGLQGAGKTTSVGKLGKFLREKHKKKVLVVPRTFIARRRSNSWKPWPSRSASISSRLTARSRSISLTPR